jgi:hypothetical protein
MQWQDRQRDAHGQKADEDDHRDGQEREGASNGRYIHYPELKAGDIRPMIADLIARWRGVFPLENFYGKVFRVAAFAAANRYRRACPGRVGR